MIDLIDRMREIIERHRVAEFTARHVVQEIVARLGLRAEEPVSAKGETRYVSAWFDDELTKLEGAE